MVCKNCGGLHYEPYCPYCGAPGILTRKQKGNRSFFGSGWIWLFAIIILLVSSFFFVNDGAPTSSIPGQTIDEQKATVTQAKSKKYNVGDQFQVDGLNITYVKAEGWYSSEAFHQPEAGYRIIRIQISAENVSTIKKNFYDFHFICYADDIKQDHYRLAEDTILEGALSPGRRVEGFIYFIVPENATEIEVEYNPNYDAIPPVILRVNLTR